MSIAVTGSTGHLGRIVIEKLRGRVDTGDIVALARSLSKAKDLGCAVREADYDRPETLAPALEGVATLLLISSSELGKRAKQHHNVIEAAKQAGVARIVYTSILHADTSPLGIAQEHRATESALKASGLPHTLLRNGWYTENYDGPIRNAVGHGALVGSAGDGKVSSAARADFAEAAVVALTGEGHVGKTYELAGDDAFTLTDLAAEISRQTGKNIPYKNLPEPEYAALLVQAGLPQDFARLVASWDVCISQGALFDDGRQLSSLTGKPTTPVATSVEMVLTNL